MNYNNVLGKNGLSLTSVSKAIGISNQSLGQKLKGKNRQYLTYLEEKKLLDHLFSFRNTLNEFLEESELYMQIRYENLKDKIQINLKILKFMNTKSIILEHRPSTNEEIDVIVEFIVCSMIVDMVLFPLGEIERDFKRSKEENKISFKENCSFITSKLKGKNYLIINLTDYSNALNDDISCFHSMYLLNSNGEVSDESTAEYLSNKFEDNLSIQAKLVNLIIKGEINEEAHLLFSKLKEEKKSIAKDDKIGKDYIQYLNDLTLNEIIY